jgi:1-acyl-sn-glycerol-3-phosphate acyltransferase
MIKRYKKHKHEYGLGFIGASASVLLFYFFRYGLAPLIKKIWIKEIVGLENLPKKGPYIVASNHESYFDFICFWAVSPHQIQYLAAEKFYDSPFWRPIMVATGQIKVERKSNDKKKVHEQAHYILKNKGVLGIFPEGTRSRSGEIGKAYHGVTRFALEAKVPIVPVGMIGTYDILPPHKNFPALKQCKIKISPPINHSEHYEQEHTKELLRHLTDNLMLHIANLVNKEYRHHYSLEKDKNILEGLSEKK